jgi:hypothetical protein
MGILAVLCPSLASGQPDNLLVIIPDMLIAHIKHSLQVIIYIRLGIIQLGCLWSLDNEVYLYPQRALEYREVIPKYGLAYKGELLAKICIPAHIVGGNHGLLPGASRCMARSGSGHRINVES